MKKRTKIVLAWIGGALVMLVVALQVLLNSRLVANIIQTKANEYIEGSLSFSKHRISLFREYPNIRLSLDSLKLRTSYTEASIAHIRVSVNPLYLFANRLKLQHFEISGLKIDPFYISQSPFAENLSQFDSLCVGLDLRQLSLGGCLNFSDSLNLCSAWANIDSLALYSELFALEVPLCLDGALSLNKEGEDLKAHISSLDLNVAYIPMHIEGGATLYRDSTAIDAKLSIKDCPLGTILHKYAIHFLPIVGDFATNALLDLEARALGTMSEDTFPTLSLSTSIPKANLNYRPLDLGGFVELDASAFMDSNKIVDLSINQLNALSDGFTFTANASVKDLLGEDPSYKLKAEGLALLDSLVRMLPDSLGLKASGRMEASLLADAKQSAFSSGRFGEADLSGKFLGSNLRFSSDSIQAYSTKPQITLSSGQDGLKLNASLDSLYLALGQDKLKTNKMNLAAGLRKRVQTEMTRQQRDSIRRSQHRPLRELPDYLQEKDFRKGDLSISLDSSITKFLQDWSPTLRMRLGYAEYLGPKMPIGVNVAGLDLMGNDQLIYITPMKVHAGASELTSMGQISNYRGVLMGRSRRPLSAELLVNAQRLDINEIVEALYQGGILGDNTATKDSVPLNPLFIVPANLDARVMLRAKELVLRDILVDSLSVSLKSRERTLQLTDASFKSNYGDMKMDAYYSTKTKQDISAGLNLKLSNLNANQLIHLLPTVDDLMPALKSFDGILACELSATTQLDTNMNIIIPSLDGLIKVSGEDLEVKDAGDLKRLTRLLLFKNKDIGRIDNLYASAVVHDSKLELFPFELGVDRYRLALYGMQGFDSTMYYHVSILRSPFLLRFGINLYGTTDNWRFSLAAPKFRSGRVPSFQNEVDNVQINISKTIKDVFNSNVDQIRLFNETNKEILDRKRLTENFRADQGGEDLSMEEIAQIGDIGLEEELNQMELDLEREVESILEDSYKDTAKIMKEYGEQAYSKGIRSQIQKLKAQAEKKRAAK